MKNKVTSQERKLQAVWREQEDAKFQQSLKKKGTSLPNGLPKEAINFAEILIKKSKKLQKYICGLGSVPSWATHRYYFFEEVIRYKSDWIRKPEDWNPKTYSLESQIISLLQWLFGKYPVPEFMACVWLDQAMYGFIPWYLAIGKGESLKTLKNFPALTSKMRHIFLNTPSKYNVPQAVYRAAILALKGNQNLINTVMKSRLIDELGSFSYWLTLIQFFINHPMLAYSQFEPLIDYINHMREPSSEALMA